MKLLVFGQTGQVARELQARAGPDLEIVALGRDRANLEDPAACAEQVAQTGAEAVINAAAYTGVDRAEAEEARATVINGAAPAAMAEAAVRRGVPFLHVSTDYVFDGSGSAPFAPGDRPAPTIPRNVPPPHRLARGYQPPFQQSRKVARPRRKRRRPGIWSGAAP